MSLQLIVFAFGAAGVLAVALMLEAPTMKWLWLSVFGTLAIIGAVLTIITYEKPVTAEDVVREMAGANNYCFLQPVIIDPKNLSASAPIQLVNQGSVPIPDLQVFISPYWIHGDAKFHPEVYSSLPPGLLHLNCSVGAYVIGLLTLQGQKPLTLAPGRYRVEFTTTLGTGWVEVLTIEQLFDNLVGVVDVFVPGKKPYHSPRPSGYVEWGQLP